jgi:hypothetical protein
VPVMPLELGFGEVVMTGDMGSLHGVNGGQPPPPMGNPESPMLHCARQEPVTTESKWRFCTAATTPAAGPSAAASRGLVRGGNK